MELPTHDPWEADVMLAEHIPEIVELDCNSFIVSAAGVTLVDAKMRIATADGQPRSPLDLD